MSDCLSVLHCVLDGFRQFICSNPFVIFSGGMPRASHGDRNTVTVIHGSEHVVFDLTSKILDFNLITRHVRSAEGKSITLWTLLLRLLEYVENSAVATSRVFSSILNILGYFENSAFTASWVYRVFLSTSRIRLSRLLEYILYFLSHFLEFQVCLWSEKCNIQEF